MGKLKGAANTLFSSLESSRRRRNSNEVHKCLVLPWELHRVAVEIAFREGIKFKDMMAIVIGKEVLMLEDNTRTNDDRPSFTFGSTGQYVHTSVFLSQDLLLGLKKGAHYARITEKQVIMNGLTDYLLLEYGDKYPELIQSIQGHMPYGQQQ